jgi:phospholipid/cholesterol/gamma-HCH transport system ATP-binding protein
VRHPQRLGARDDLHLNVLARLQPLPDMPKPPGREGVHQFIGEARRGVERAESVQRSRLVAGLFLQFALGGCGRVFIGFEFPGGELPQAFIHGDAIVAYHDQPIGIDDRHDDHRARMPYDLTTDGTAARVGPGEDFDIEQRPRMDGFDTPLVHQDDDRSSPNGDARPATAGEAPRRSHSTVASARQPIVQLKGIHKSFGRQHVLRGITLDFATGRTTVVLGPSGCGKSVMLKHIVCLLRPDIGAVYYDGHRIDQLRESRLADIRQQFGFLFQMGALFDSMAVRENVAFPLTEHTELSAAQVEQRVQRVLQMVGLEDINHKMPADLSGGQRKRIALARAIVLEPKVILYDEPTTGLDPIRSDVINELILKLQRELRVTSIVVTHDLASAFKVADHMVMMHEGRILFHGTPDELKASDNDVVQRFLRGEASEEELAGIRAIHPPAGQQPLERT